jgi:hypothetical protein
MDLEGKKNNLYYDQTGRQILVGDLLKVFHFRTGKRNHYMYHVAVMEETEPFHVMAFKTHYNNKPHYRAYVVANAQRAILSAKIIAVRDWETKRQKIKLDEART